MNYASYRINLTSSSCLNLSNGYEWLSVFLDAQTKVSVFETDKFSDLALVYKGEKIKTNDTTTPVKKEKTGIKDKTKKTETTTTVNTSDNTNGLM